MRKESIIECNESKQWPSIHTGPRGLRLERFIEVQWKYEIDITDESTIM